MKRDIRKTLRLAAGELERYEKGAEAEGVEFSEWVRRACEQRLAAQAVPEGLKETLEETLAEARQEAFGPPSAPVTHAPHCICRRCNPTPTVASVARIDREKRS